MMAAKVLVSVFVLLALAFRGTNVSAETHHVVGGGEKDLDVGSWLSGRVFRVGDKILFNFGDEEKIVELGPEEFKTCDVSNPIRMYTDDHVVLDKEGTRYFVSANLENCKKGLRIPVSVEGSDEQPAGFDPPFTPQPFEPPPQPFEPPPHPLPVYPPPPPPPSEPSLAVDLKAISSALFVGLGLLFCVVFGV